MGDWLCSLCLGTLFRQLLLERVHWRTSRTTLPTLLSTMLGLSPPTLFQAIEPPFIFFL
ncbi:hypothetical protein GIB67_031135 [Kingdonia uniflora]|uniref:Uncharacterized protein n=1 Tax=Kingdonia uniflora TaxID=39325 RepID=A0A7J7ME86_9MAGN|nr:hypothetical protein GIB67_031135 [Kingdonia uniflora]